MHTYIHTNILTHIHMHIHTYKQTSTDKQDSPQSKSMKYKLPVESEGSTSLYMGDSNTAQSGTHQQVSPSSSTTTTTFLLSHLSIFSSFYFSSSHLVSEKRSSRSSFSQLVQQGVGSLAQALSQRISSTRGSFSGIPTPTGG